MYKAITAYTKEKHVQLFKLHPPFKLWKFLGDETERNNFYGSSSPEDKKFADEPVIVHAVMELNPTQEILDQWGFREIKDGLLIFSKPELDSLGVMVEKTDVLTTGIYNKEFIVEDANRKDYDFDNENYLHLACNVGNYQRSSLDFDGTRVDPDVQPEKSPSDKEDIERRESSLEEDEFYM